MPYLERSEDVFVLNLGERGSRDSENAFHPDWLVQVAELLDEVESHDGPAALVTTAAGKFYSTGLDTTWVVQNTDKLNAYIDRVQELFARILTFPLPTVAALSGHTFGGGAILATAHDHRIMREDRGYFCLPGISIGASYAPGSIALLAARLPAPAAHTGLVTGRRYGGTAALAAGLVDDVAGEHDVLARAVEHAGGLASTRGRTLGEIKTTLYADVVASLRTPVRNLETQEALSAD
ncbi:enoyl-CoA hydratase/isomerase family protein [Rhodococcus tibetensis]|uniref:Enoyl-CoA hydratase/isomerase family protein n=1 Tax=Rhodococcus tibetensis TaxID=2965064 RepID=A0ABT1Q894_9NOCA|nr:enoyl-CoA hydratase/isomerase family protein [Rhodococcus sp. FXJ9.536]MCQ4118451.1 enoyl-CoA hydratase/isomerase family protein [Rhodococcus sp. FXJ9.536]